MRGFQELKTGVEELMSRYIQARKDLDEIKEENERLKKNIDYLQGSQGMAPEINKKLLEERKIIDTKVKRIIKLIEEADLV